MDLGSSVCVHNGRRWVSCMRYSLCLVLLSLAVSQAVVLICFGVQLIALQDMEAAEIGSILRHPAMGRTVLECVKGFPSLNLEAQLQPITRSAYIAVCCP